jgi:hypothetical protein
VSPLSALRAVLLVLLLVGVAWFVRSRRWREKRLVPVGVALLVALALLSRRVGWGELLVLAAVVVVPAVLFTPRRR